jgi:hypothetical protein
MRVPQIPWNQIFSSKTIFARLNKINDMSKSGQKNYMIIYLTKGLGMQDDCA